jgi:hypothetical protein
VCALNCGGADLFRPSYDEKTAPWVRSLVTRVRRTERGISKNLGVVFVVVSARWAAGFRPWARPGIAYETHVERKKAWAFFPQETGRWFIRARWVASFWPRARPGVAWKTHVEWKKRESFVRKKRGRCWQRTVSSGLQTASKIRGRLKNLRWAEKAWAFCSQETGWFIRAQWAAGSVKLLVTGKTWGRLRVHVERQEVKTFSVSARNGVVHSAQWAAKSVKAFRRGQDPGSLKTHGEQREVFHFSKVATCRGRLVFCSCSFFCVGCVVEKWAVYGVRRRRQWPKEEGSWTGGERAWPAPMERETATTR